MTEPRESFTIVFSNAVFLDFPGASSVVVTVNIYDDVDVPAASV